MKPMFLMYEVSLSVLTRLCGGTPKSEGMREKWIKSKVEDETVADGLIKQANQQMSGVDGDISDYSWNTFKRGSNGNLIIEGRCIKAMFKESANILKDFMDITAFKSRVAERVFVWEDDVDLGVTEPSGSYESYVHAMTMSGPINAIKRVDYVTTPTVKFTLRVFNEAMKCKTKGKAVDPQEYIESLLQMGGELGIGAERSQGNGRFVVASMEEI